MSAFENMYNNRIFSNDPNIIYTKHPIGSIQLEAFENMFGEYVCPKYLTDDPNVIYTNYPISSIQFDDYFEDMCCKGDCRGYGTLKRYETKTWNVPRFKTIKSSRNLETSGKVSRWFARRIPFTEQWWKDSVGVSKGTAKVLKWGMVLGILGLAGFYGYNKMKQWALTEDVGA